MIFITHSKDTPVWCTPLGDVYWRIRKLYVRLHPLISIKSRDFRVMYIMRGSPLIDYGLPFFLEPWLSPDDLRDWEDVDGELVAKFKTRRTLTWLFARNFIRDMTKYTRGKISE